ncbi:MAG: amidohydrolase family protein [Gammaproteobacteria bacterium]
MLQVIHAGWIIPIRPEKTILKNYSLIVQDSLIVALIPTTEWIEPSDEYESIDCRNDVLLPGLVNTQAGASLSLLRGVDHTDSRYSWLQKGFLPQNFGGQADRFIKDSVLIAGAEMLLSGTTCFSESCVSGEYVAAATISLGMRSVPGILITNESNIWSTNLDDSLTKAQNLYDQYRSHPLINWTFATQISDITQRDTLSRLGTIGDELDLSLRLNVSANLSQASNLMELELANLNGMKLIVSHVPPLHESEIQLVKKCGICICHTPSNSINKSNQECEISILTASGCDFGLGTDSTFNNSTFDLFKEMRVASLQLSHNDNELVVNAFDIIELATLGGASVLGMENDIGSLEPGKSADIVSVHLTDGVSSPLCNIEKLIVNRGDSCQVRQVWVRGKQVVKDSMLTTIDSKNLSNRVQGWNLPK